MNVLILAAGEQTRWLESSGWETPKQLVDIGGEPLLYRTVRQVRGYDWMPIIVTHDPRLLAVPGSLPFVPTDSSTVLATWLSTRDLWDVRTVVLLGDVYYTKAAMWKIIACRDPIRVFGRTELKGRVVGRYYEIFAISYGRDRNQRIEHHLWELVGTLCQEKECKLRSFYDRWCGLPPGEYQHDDTVIFPVNDHTEDFDLFEDYQQFEELIINQGKLNDVGHLIRG